MQRQKRPPHRERVAWARAQVKRVVTVERLRLLSRMEANRLQVREEEIRKQLRAQERHHPRMFGESKEGLALPREAVDALRELSFESGAPHRSLDFVRRERLDDRLQLSVREQTLEDDVAISIKLLELLRAQIGVHGSERTSSVLVGFAGPADRPVSTGSHRRQPEVFSA